MSGAELLKVVRRRFPQVPVIFISGDTAGEMPEGVAADAYCHKNGFGVEQLLEIISELTKKPPSQTIPPRVDNKRVQAIGNRDGNYTIGCLGCFREFSVPRTWISDTLDWHLCRGYENQDLFAQSSRSA